MYYILAMLSVCCCRGRGRGREWVCVFVSVQGTTWSEEAGEPSIGSLVGGTCMIRRHMNVRDTPKAATDFQFFLNATCT